MTEKPSPENADSKNAGPAHTSLDAAGNAVSGSTSPTDTSPGSPLASEQPDVVRRAHGGRDHRAFLAEMAADLELYFRNEGMFEEAEQQRQARSILETPVEPVYDAMGNETLSAHDRIMYRYYMALGNSAGAQIHRDNLAARGESLQHL